MAPDPPCTNNTGGPAPTSHADVHLVPGQAHPVLGGGQVRVRPQGSFGVDDRCIDCNAARQVAPGLIGRNPDDGVSVFTRQPTTDEERAMAWRAVLVCPTRSVGHETIPSAPTGRLPARPRRRVHRLGHNATDSFGAHSYLVVRAGGNLLVDAPRWTQQLLGPTAELGGIDHVLLTHRDDVAAADRPRSGSVPAC